MTLCKSRVTTCHKRQQPLTITTGEKCRIRQFIKMRVSAYGNGLGRKKLMASPRPVGCLIFEWPQNKDR